MPRTTSLPGSSVWSRLTRRRIVAGTCAACGGNVHGDEHPLRIHGMLLHRRCVPYRPATRR